MIYHIYANRSNIGDWLSAKGIQKLLAPLPVTECLCDEPFIAETMLVLSSATEHDLIVIGGGGLLMDYFEPFWIAFQTVAEKVPYCLWGVGYCDNKQQTTLPSKALIQEIVNGSRLCIVRDEMTRAHLTGCRLPAPVICPSVVVLDPLPKKETGLLHVANFSSVGEHTYDLMRHDLQAFAEKTGRTYRETNNRIAKDSEKEMADCLLRYQKSELVVSSGLHGCIIGLCLGLKVLAVSADKKIEGFMESVGQKDWVLDVREAHRVPEWLGELHEQQVPQTILQDARRKHQQIAEQIKAMVRR